MESTSEAGRAHCSEAAANTLREQLPQVALPLPSRHHTAARPLSLSSSGSSAGGPDSFSLVPGPVLVSAASHAPPSLPPVPCPSPDSHFAFSSRPAIRSRPAPSVAPHAAPERRREMAMPSSGRCHHQGDGDAMMRFLFVMRAGTRRRGFSGPCANPRCRWCWSGAGRWRSRARGSWSPTSSSACPTELDPSLDSDDSDESDGSDGTDGSARMTRMTRMVRHKECMRGGSGACGPRGRAARGWSGPSHSCQARRRPAGTRTASEGWGS